MKSILHLLPQNYLPFGWGVMKITLSGLTLRMQHIKFGYTNLIFLEKYGPLSCLIEKSSLNKDNFYEVG